MLKVHQSSSKFIITHGFRMCRYSQDRWGIKGEDKTTQEPNKKHAIKPSVELRTGRRAE